MSLSPYTKKQQTKKTKSKRPTRFKNRAEKIDFIDFIREESEGICQMPTCNNRGQDFMHSKMGTNRDDYRGIIGCRECHTICDNPSPKQIEQSKALNRQLVEIAEENYVKYNTRKESL